MGKAPRRLFSPLSWVVARAPLLPVEAFLALAGEPAEADFFWRSADAQATPESSAAAMALMVGAGHLSEAIQAHDEISINGNDSADLRQKRLRYRIRMSTRPTPYGAFAGVALCDTGPSTRLKLDGSHRRSARPDMEWLLSFIAELEKRDDVLRQLVLVAHPCLVARAGRVVLEEPTPLTGDASPVSIGASPFVLAALNASRTPTKHDVLLQSLMRDTGADATRSMALVRELVDQGLLLTELRPPLTCATPARYLLDRLRSLPEPPAQAEGLADALDSVSHWVQLDPPIAARELNRLNEKFVTLHAGPKALLQVDLALGFAHATVGNPLLDIAADTAELLLRLSPLPNGPPALIAYRSAFISRYGKDRRIPLLELLDAHTGLGVLGIQGSNLIDGRRLARRQDTLQVLAQSAMAEHRIEVELDDGLLARLSLWDLQPEKLPTSIDLCLFVLADSITSANSEDWRVVVGPNLGSRQAGRYLGRFAELLGPRGHAALFEAAQAEKQHAVGAIWAESVHMPKRPRSANVAIRPVVRTHQIALGVPAGVPPEQTIPLAEILVGLNNDRLCLFWREQEVRVCAGHMLNSFQAPQVSRFLEELGQDGVAQLSGFDWGAAANYIFLPRIARRRIILSPAQWRISRGLLGGKEALSVEAFPDRLREFSARWRLPQYVYLVEGDNRLLLDLSNREQADQLRIDLARRSEFGAIILHEALPGPKDAWAEAARGHSIVELVVPLVRRPTHSGGMLVSKSGLSPNAALLPTTYPAGAVLDQMRPPGTDWLFVKVYGEASQEEALLSGSVREFCDRQLRLARCASWFFVRYADPHPHVRIRVRGDPNRLLAELLPEVCAWGAELMVSGQATRFAIETYEREVDRYGGPEGLAWAEAVFAADSVWIATLFNRLNDKIVSGTNIDRWSLLTISIDRLLADLGMNVDDRLAWCRRQVQSRHVSGDAYRQHKPMLRAWFSRTNRAAHWPEWLSTLLDERERRFRPLGERWDELQRQDRIRTSRDSILGSIVHMHCNRFAGTNQVAEDTSLGMLLRLRESLAKAPPSP